MKLESKRLDYAWIIVAVCFALEFVILGFCSGTKGLFLASITDALGLKRSLFSINDSLRYITTAVIYLFFGTLMRRFGTRKMIAAGCICLILSMLLYATSEQIMGFYLGGILLGVGLALTTSTMVPTIIRRWCSGAHVGKILGVVLGANGVGAAVATQMLNPLIHEEGNPFGYRKAYLLIIPFVLVTGILSVIFIKDAPEDAAAASGTQKKKVRGQSWTGISYETAKKKPYFYLALVCVLLTGMMLQGMTGVSAAHMTGVGLDPDYVAGVVSFYSLVLTAAKFITGASYDRFGLRTTILVSHVLAVLAMVMLAAVTNTTLGMGVALGYGVLSALALPLETIMLSLITNDLFGSHSFEKLLGIVSAVNTAGYALGAPLINACYDMFDTYVPVFYIFAGMMVAVAVLFQMVIRAAKKEKEAILAQR